MCWLGTILLVYSWRGAKAYLHCETSEFLIIQYSSFSSRISYRIIDSRKVLATNRPCFLVKLDHFISPIKPYSLRHLSQDSPSVGFLALALFPIEGLRDLAIPCRKLLLSGSEHLFNLSRAEQLPGRENFQLKTFLL